MENNYQAAIESLINNKYGIPKEAITGAVRKYASLQGWSIQSPQFHNFIEKMYKECNGDESEFFKKIYFTVNRNKFGKAETYNSEKMENFLKGKKNNPTEYDKTGNTEEVEYEEAIKTLDEYIKDIYSEQDLMNICRTFGLRDTNTVRVMLIASFLNVKEKSKKSFSVLFNKLNEYIQKGVTDIIDMKTPPTETYLIKSKNPKVNGYYGGAVKVFKLKFSLGSNKAGDGLPKTATKQEKIDNSITNTRRVRARIHNVPKHERDRNDSMKDESVSKKNVIITESMVKMIEEEKVMTEYKFINNIRHFLGNLLNDPVKATPCFNLVSNGLNKNKLIKHLKDNNILISNQRLNDKDNDGNAKTVTMKIKYLVPKEGFERKLQKLYSELFPNPSEDLDECTGCCGAGGDGAFSCEFVAPMSGVPLMRRTNKKRKKKRN